MVDKVNLAMSFKIFDYQKKEERIFKRDSSMNFQEKLSVSLKTGFYVRTVRRLKF